MVTSHDDDSIQFWGTLSDKPFQTILSGQKIRDFTISPDNQYIVILAAVDGIPMATTSSVYLYQIDPGDLLYQYVLPDCRCITFLDNQELAIGRLGRGTKDKYNFIDFYSVENFQKLSALQLPKNEMSFELTYHPDLKILCSVGIGFIIVNSTQITILNHFHCDNIQVDWDIWETSSMSPIRKVSYIAVGFSAFKGNQGKRVNIYNLETGSSLGWFIDDKRPPKNLAISDDGNYLASTLDNSNVVSIHAITSGHLIASIIVDKVTSLTFLPVCHHLVIGSESKRPLLVWEWDL